MALLMLSDSKSVTPVVKGTFLSVTWVILLPLYFYIFLYS